MSDERARTEGAGSADRLTALSDGIFAIAMTQLVLDIRVPPGPADDGFRHALRDALPDLGAYAPSFDPAVRNTVRPVSTDLWTTALDFGVSVPLALVARPVVALWFRPAVVPLRGLVRRRGAS
ncbi:TMEM175 family protein [Streptomyces sp. NPDC005892]|uniref:TMEM175 family protein n=1 Tax=Streptomyces sp. NPDC005892 TaxID=3155593 RepID=UPI0033E94F4C